MVRNDQVSRLDGFKADFLKAHGEEKKRLRGEIDALRQEIAAWAHRGSEMSGFDWQVEFAEVFAHDVDGNGDAGGFDVILANPPYVSQKFIKHLKPHFKNVFPEVYTGTADLYVYFYARALQLLRTGGMLAFISSNTWFRTEFGTKLRKHVADTTNIRSITDFGDLPVFESATAYPMIFLAQKNARAAIEPTILTQVESLAPPYPDVAAIVRDAGRPLPSNSIDGPNWSLVDSATALRLTKINAGGTSLKDYVGERVYRGLTTGFNRAFIVSGAKREELISQDPKSVEIIRPFVAGRDVKKWSINGGKWLIATPIGVAIERYPAVFEHLKQWQTELEQRYDKGKHWWELRACNYYSAFDELKIVSTKVSIRPSFTLDSSGSYLGNTAYFLPARRDATYLLGLLNSNAFFTYAKEVFVEKQNGWYEVQPKGLETFSIPDAPAAERETITSLVQKCLEAKGVNCEDWEAEIDERVSALYGLTDGP
jgi:hypothetical protein